MSTRSTAPMRLLAGWTALLLTAGVLALLTPGTARADSAPPDPSPAAPVTVTADGLPTVQINGVAWAQAVVGDTVYVAGSFTRARPAGAAPGTSETVRNNILAYDIRSGELITSFAPSLNAQALAITASPDGSRIYVAGDFTSVNGQTRNRVAALTPSGDLVASFRPSVNSQVRAVAATNETVYLGGSITAVGGVSRHRLAAVAAADGALLPWAPVPGVGSTDGNRNGNTSTSDAVLALVVTGGGSQVVAAGRFDSLNGIKATGVGALDAVTAETRPFAINELITNQGVNSAIYSLSTDGPTVYGTGYDYYGPGNLEGSFAAAADGGAVIAINACHGDTYSSFAMSGALYLATHAHQCAPIGGFPEQSPRVNKFATAVTTTAHRTVTGPMLRGISFVGQPGPNMLNWFPTMSPGTYTRQYQAGWNVTGNSEYVVFGGEFPRVNGVAQQGLVRYTLPTNGAPNGIGPVSSDNLTPTAVSLSAGTARVSWRTTYDNDNEYLTYRVVRDGNTAAPVYETPAPGVASTWWNMPTIGFVDRGLTPGATYTYRVYAVDPFGNQVTRGVTSVVVSADEASGGVYADTVAADGAASYWRLDEPAGSPDGYDQIGFDDLAVGTGVTRGVPGALSGSTNTASGFDGTSAGLAATKTPVPGPNTFSVEAWFKTATTAGGKIIGFGSANTGISANRDRHVYMDLSGRVFFGIWTGSRQAIGGSGTYNDDQWHHVVATLGPDGMKLYVDGVQTGARSTVTAGQAYNGYWRIGGDRGWVGADYWTGSVDDVAIYPTVLSAGQVANHHSVGSSGTAINVPPTAAFTATPTDLTAAFDAATSADSDGTIASYEWDFGDGQTGTGVTTSHTYTTAGAYTVTLTVTDDDGDTATATREVTVTDPPPNVAPTADFSATPSDLTVAVDASASADSDGAIESYAWDFGDGQTGTGVTTSHTYTTAGAYTVTLTVTDDDGDTATATREVTATDPPVNAAPVAGFSATVTDLTVAVDASASTDSDGTIASYEWDFGDGRVGSTVTASNVYASAGTYTVTLTVTDDDGATATATEDVTVTAPAGPAVLAEDTFNRTVVNGLGTADTGGAWTVWAGGTRQSVSSGVAELRLPSSGNNTGSYLGEVSAASTDLLTSFSVSSTPTGYGTYVYVTGRRVGAGLEYRVRVRLLPDGRVALALSRLSGGIEGFPGGEQVVPGLTHTAGETLNVRVETSGTGTTQIDATVWRSGEPEPATPSMTRTDTTAALQEAGAVGLLAHRPSNTTLATTVLVTSLRVTAGGDGEAAPVNAAPTAAFVAESTDLAVAVDASTSADSDGTIASYAWDFGDGGSGTGVTASHTYATGGTYTVTLTVTDDDGATATATEEVVVTAPPAGNTLPAAAFTADPTELTVAVDGSASSDSDGTIASYAWDFGDGGTGTGVTASHTYGAAGTYTVTLTVTDDQGGTATATQDVTVAEGADPPADPAVLAEDTFNRTVTGGLGTADTGGDWTVSAGGTRQSVTPGAAVLTLPSAGNNTGSYLGGISSTRVDVLTSFSLSSAPTGSGTYLYVAGRRVDAGLEYRVRVRMMADGQVALTLSRLSDGTEAFPGGEVIVPGLTYTVGETMNVRVQISGTGTTEITARVWRSGETEPEAASMTRTDTTAALQAAGHVGLRAHRPSNSTAATEVRLSYVRITELP